jgi:hypothetical protein
MSSSGNKPPALQQKNLTFRTQTERVKRKSVALFHFIGNPTSTPVLKEVPISCCSHPVKRLCPVRSNQEATRILNWKCFYYLKFSKYFVDSRI